jgi:ATP/ADP translocase
MRAIVEKKARNNNKIGAKRPWIRKACVERRILFGVQLVYTVLNMLCSVIINKYALYAKHLCKKQMQKLAMQKKKCNAKKVCGYIQKS